MTPDQDRLFRQLTNALSHDPRIKGVWLTGSFGRGEGDAWSDIDLLAEVEPADQAACISDYQEPRPGMPEAVHILVAHGVVVSVITPEWQRFDLTFMTRPQIGAVLDADQLRPIAGSADDPLAFTPRPADTGAAARVERLAREFLRVAGLAPGGVARQEWLVMQQGGELLRRMVIDAMLEANAVPPSARGAKALNAHLTAEQRRSLEAIAPPPAEREALVAGIGELARLFFAEAKPLAAKVGAAWPDAFEAATRAHLKAALSLDI